MTDGVKQRTLLLHTVLCTYVTYGEGATLRKSYRTPSLLHSNFAISYLNRVCNSFAHFPQQVFSNVFILQFVLEGFCKINIVKKGRVLHGTINNNVIDIIFQPLYSFLLFIF